MLLGAPGQLLDGQVGAGGEKPLGKPASRRTNKGKMRSTIIQAAMAKIEEAANISGSYWPWLVFALAVAAAASPTGLSSWLCRTQ